MSQTSKFSNGKMHKFLDSKIGKFRKQNKCIRLDLNPKVRQNEWESEVPSKPTCSNIPLASVEHEELRGFKSRLDTSVAQPHRIQLLSHVHANSEAGQSETTTNFARSPTNFRPQTDVSQMKPVAVKAKKDIGTEVLWDELGKTQPIFRQFHPNLSPAESNTWRDAVASYIRHKLTESQWVKNLKACHYKKLYMGAKPRFEALKQERSKSVTDRSATRENLSWHNGKMSNDLVSMRKTFYSFISKKS